jgi:hypothetical protein
MKKLKRANDGTPSSKNSPEILKKYFFQKGVGIKLIFDFYQEIFGRIFMSSLYEGR